MRNSIRDYKDQWTSDITVAHLAATYSQLKMDKEGYELLGYARDLPPISSESDYCDELVNRATYLYLVSKHFPADARKMSGGAILALADPLSMDRRTRFRRHARFLLLARMRKRQALSRSRRLRSPRNTLMDLRVHSPQSAT